MKDESKVIYKLVHELYKTAGGEYRTTACNNLEAIDSDLFMRCFQRVEYIFSRY